MKFARPSGARIKVQIRDSERGGRSLMETTERRLIRRNHRVAGSQQQNQLIPAADDDEDDLKILSAARLAAQVLHDKHTKHLKYLFVVRFWQLR